jgi:glycerophosphoryl diester phosphodiesterase
MTNPWLARRVLRYGHQGGAREAPSSTMFAFHQALANGADALEMDVHRAADGVLVVCHDETIDRTTNFSGRIDSLTVQELRRADNAHWWAPGHQAIFGLRPEEYPLRGRAPGDSSLSIALLSEVLEAFPDVFLNFDIKGGAVPYEAELATVLRAYDRSDDVIVASFNDSALQRFRTAAPEIHTSASSDETWTIARALGPLGDPSTVEIPHGVVALQVPYRFEPNGPALFDAPFVRRAHDAGLAVHVWTIDDPHEMHELLDFDVDGIVTDCPSVLTRVLQERIGNATPI